MPAGDAALAQIAVGKRAGERLRQAKQPPRALRSRSLDWRIMLRVAPARRRLVGQIRPRKAEKATGLVGDIAEVDKAGSLAQEVEQITVLPGRGIRPLAGAWAGKVYIERAALIVANIANDPVIACPPAGGEVVAADRLGTAREKIRQF